MPAASHVYRRLITAAIRLRPESQITTKHHFYKHLNPLDSIISLQVLTICYIYDELIYTKLTKTNKRSTFFKDKSYWISKWIKFNSGDRTAFEEIYIEYINVLFSYGSKMTNDKDLIKDSIQDVFIDLYRYKINLRQPESFEYYLFKSLKRLIQKKLKIKSKTRDFENQDFFAFELIFNLEEDYIQKETEISKLKVLQEILFELNQNDRELLFYKFNSNLTYKEIGKLIGLNTDAVKKKIYRIIKHLRKAYNIKTFRSEVTQF